MESPQLHQFFDNGPHPAGHLNEVAFAVLDIVEELNSLRDKLARFEAKCPGQCEECPAKNSAPAPKAGGRSAATK